ncbi:MAG TPA: hypothetical protein VGN15_05440, partial [Ktedonobacteraceae bacterium]|nr:hypothetical protein [Ktedonobacteraceae bacterium]
MAATLRQQHPAHQGVRPFAILIAAPTKGLLIGRGIGNLEDGSVNGHQPIAPIEGTGHRVRL